MEIKNNQFNFCFPVFLDFTVEDQWLLPFLPEKQTHPKPFVGCRQLPRNHCSFCSSEIERWFSITTMAQNWKPELTQFRAFVPLQSNSARCSVLSRGWSNLVLCRACLWLHMMKLIKYVEGGRTGLMLCRQLKSMNWIKPRILVCFDAILCFDLDAFWR